MPSGRWSAEYDSGSPGCAMTALLTPVMRGLVYAVVGIILSIIFPQKEWAEHSWIESDWFFLVAFGFGFILSIALIRGHEVLKKSYVEEQRRLT